MATRCFPLASFATRGFSPLYPSGHHHLHSSYHCLDCVLDGCGTSRRVRPLNLRHTAHSSLPLQVPGIQFFLPHLLHYFLHLYISLFTLCLRLDMLWNGSLRGDLVGLGCSCWRVPVPSAMFLCFTIVFPVSNYPDPPIPCPFCSEDLCLDVRELESDSLFASLRYAVVHVVDVDVRSWLRARSLVPSDLPSHFTYVPTSGD